MISTLVQFNEYLLQLMVEPGGDNVFGASDERENCEPG